MERSHLLEVQQWEANANKAAGHCLLARHRASRIASVTLIQRCVLRWALEAKEATTKGWETRCQALMNVVDKQQATLCEVTNQPTPAPPPRLYTFAISSFEAFLL